METANSISLEQYLRRDYENERECEFVDGHLEERTGGDMAHGALHAAVGSWFWQNRSAWQIQALASYSIRVSPSRIRIPDIVVTTDALREEIRLTPPFLCVEILAPEDKLAHLLPRLDDLLSMGIPHVWLLDPIERAAFTYTRDGLKLVSTPHLTIPNSPIFLDLPELFAALD